MTSKIIKIGQLFLSIVANNMSGCFFFETRCMYVCMYIRLKQLTNRNIDNTASTLVLCDRLTHSLTHIQTDFYSAYGVRSVCLSVKFECFVQMNEVTILRFSASGRTSIIHVVSGEVKIFRIFAGITNW